MGVGVIGAGVIAGIYMQNMPLFAGLALRACADIRPEAAAAQAEKYGTRALTVDALLAASDIDLVLNLTVPNAHFAVSHDALTAGKHVFSEKPLCTTVEDGRRLVAAAESRGLRLGCAPDTFLGAGGRLARHMVDDGKVGHIVAGSAFLMSRGMEHWHPDPEFFFKPGGGPILDVGPYYIGALVNLLGPISRVQAMSSIGFAERVVTAPGPRTGHRITVETPTTVTALLQFTAGAQVTLAMSWDVHKHGHPAIELYGTEGSMRVPDPNFFGGNIEFTEAAGDWQIAEFRANDLWQAELAFAELACLAATAGELPLPRHGGARTVHQSRHAAPQLRAARAACARGDVRHPAGGGGRTARGRGHAGRAPSRSVGS